MDRNIIAVGIIKKRVNDMKFKVTYNANGKTYNETWENEHGYCEMLEELNTHLNACFIKWEIINIKNITNGRFYF